VKATVLMPTTPARNLKKVEGRRRWRNALTMR
jgi:hypothetical protein